MTQRTVLMLNLVCLASPAASAQPLGGDTEWVTIGAVGNGGLDRNDPGAEPSNFGRGTVGYEYRMATTEVTTGQWMEFMNAVNGTREDGTRFSLPIIFGAWHDNSYNGPGARFELRPDAGPDAARLPVGGIQWRDAARYVNWLHNGKQTDSASMTSGAYDTSTFGYLEDGRTFTDQHSRSEGAKYWIPSIDEWLKAGYYDPAKDNGDGTTGGWWLRPDGTDTDLIQGLPGTGAETSGGLGLDLDEVLPVGSYGVTSPWGLFDMSGSMGEYTETVFEDAEAPNRLRYWGGSNAGAADSLIADSPVDLRLGRIVFSPWFSLRIASAVPAPGTIPIGAVSLILLGRRRRIA